MVKLEKVKKQYKDFELDCSMEIKEGWITGLVGQNGAGKSTAFKAMLGLIRSDSGKIEILGKTPELLGKEEREQILNMLREYMEMPGRSILISSHISSDLEGFCDDLYMIDNGKIVLHEETDRLLEEYGVLKVSKEQYQELDHTYILKKHKDTFGYRCLTDQKQFYQENYPGIVIEKGNIDELITIMIQGEKI